MKNLKQLATQYKTDKSSHGFIDIYDKEFYEFRHDTFNMLEIGVFFGASIKMWNDYFSQAKIYGVDTFKGTQGNGNVFANADKYYKEWLETGKDSKIQLMKLDQSSEEELKRFVEHCNQHKIKFRVIIDDGSHLMKDQQISFFHLFELVEEGGVYIIEDLHTSDQSGYDVLSDKSNSTKHIFLDMKNNNTTFTSIYLDQTQKEKCAAITNNIRFIEHFFVKKGSETLFIHTK